MKKVLALVLAVVMVCTMAMAVSVGTATGYVPSTTPASNAVRMNAIYPGMSLVFTSTELNAAGITKASDYKVEVTFAKGAELIASQGWVETSKGVFVYAINTKENATAVQDDAADIVISAIKVTKLGQKAPVLDAKYTSKNADKEVTYAYASTGYGAVPANIPSGLGFAKLDVKPADFTGNVFAFAWDYGYNHDTLKIYDGQTITVAENTIYTIEKGDVTSAEVVTKDKTNGVEFSFTLKVGEKVSFVKLGTLAGLSTDATKALNDNADAKDAKYAAVAALEGAFVPAEKPVTIYVDGQKDGAALYLVDAKGAVKDLGAKFDANKVLTASAKLNGVVILSDKALTTTATTGTGSTTNPGTGANDVVGVAAALAVVALVSGAAISLKK